MFTMHSQQEGSSCSSSSPFILIAIIIVIITVCFSQPGQAAQALIDETALPKQRNDSCATCQQEMTQPLCNLKCR